MNIIVQRKHIFTLQRGRMFSGCSPPTIPYKSQSQFPSSLNPPPHASPHASSPSPSLPPLISSKSELWSQKTAGFRKWASCTVGINTGMFTSVKCCTTQNNAEYFLFSPTNVSTSLLMDANLVILTNKSWPWPWAKHISLFLPASVLPPSLPGNEIYTSLQLISFQFPQLLRIYLWYLKLPLSIKSLLTWKKKSNILTDIIDIDILFYIYCI